MLLCLRGLPREAPYDDAIQLLVQNDVEQYKTRNRHLPPCLSAMLTIEPHTPDSITRVSSPSGFIDKPSVHFSPTITTATSHGTTNTLHKPTSSPKLPVEIWSAIFDYVEDWELSKALGIHTHLQPPHDWTAYSTSLDLAVLSGSSRHVASILRDTMHRSSASTFVTTTSSANSSTRLTMLGVNAMIRFGYLHLLKFLQVHRKQDLLDGLSATPAFVIASTAGHVHVLEWLMYESLMAHVDSWFCPPDTMDFASREGHISVLDWWLKTGRTTYSSLALDLASMNGHIDVLEWWKASNLPLKIGRVMDVASRHGRVDVLNWWLTSGLRFEYDSQAMYIASWAGHVSVLEWWRTAGLRPIYDGRQILVAATMHNQTEVLEWWASSKLPLEYRIFDIEAALEDAIGSGNDAKDWWQRRIDFNTDNREWMESRLLD